MKVMEMDEKLESVLPAVGEEGVVLTKNGRAVLHIEPFTDDDLDDWLFEHDPATIARAERARQQIREGKGIPHDEVRKRLGALD